jgi:hypothetical protein
MRIALVALVAVIAAIGLAALVAYRQDLLSDSDMRDAMDDVRDAIPTV